MDTWRYDLVVGVANAIALWVFLFYVSPVQSNGVVAIAVPVEGIMIDGDLSDWSQAKPRREHPKLLLGKLLDFRVENSIPVGGTREPTPRDCDRGDL